jgi:hypothetical protein
MKMKTLKIIAVAALLAAAAKADELHVGLDTRGSVVAGFGMSMSRSADANVEFGAGNYEYFCGGVRLKTLSPEVGPLYITLSGGIYSRDGTRPFAAAGLRQTFPMTKNTGLFVEVKAEAINGRGISPKAAMGIYFK